MSDLFLRIRLGALDRNLREVKELATALRGRSDSIRQLQSLLASPGASPAVDLPRASKALEDIRRALETPEFADLVRDRGLMSQLTAATTSLAKLDKDLRRAQEHTQRLFGNAKETDALLSRNLVRELFLPPTKDLLRGATKLRLALDKQASDPRFEAQAWTQLRELISNTGQFDLFQEYVDVAAGLSLRGMGMDEHFFAMADWLSDYWTAVINMPDVFAIPFHREETTIRSIIRLGFPEWTVWALPLSAHEFGRILVDRDEDLQKLPEELADDVPDTGVDNPDDPQAAGAASTARASRISTYLADAFATYAMGPAYACACLLLKLDPTSVGHPLQRDGFDLVRAEVVLETLQRLMPKVEANLADVVATLRRSWEAALQHLAAPGASDAEYDLVGPVVDRVVETLGVIEAQNDCLIKFDDDDFAESKRAAGKDFANLPHRADAPSDGVDPEAAPEAGTATQAAGVPVLQLDRMTMIHVLNAAWYQRLAHPESADNIARCVREHIWPHVKPPPGAEGAATRVPPASEIRP